MDSVICDIPYTKFLFRQIILRPPAGGADQDDGNHPASQVCRMMCFVKIKRAPLLNFDKTHQSHFLRHTDI